MAEGTVYSPTTRWSEKQRQEPEGGEENAFFTTLRQHGATVEQLTFRLKNGRQHSLPSSEITEMYFAPESGIVLFFPLGLVKIQGRNLDLLHQYLQIKKVSEIREFSESSEVFFEQEALFISRIHYESDNLTRLGLAKQEA